MLQLGNMIDDNVFFVVHAVKLRLGNLGHYLDYPEESVLLIRVAQWSLVSLTAALTEMETWCVPDSHKV